MMKTKNFDLIAHLFGCNPDDNLLVKISADSRDFNKGDLLVVNTSLKPKVGDFIMVEEESEVIIDRFESGNVYGVVTATIRSL